MRALIVFLVLNLLGVLKLDVSGYLTDENNRVNRNLRDDGASECSENCEDNPDSDFPIVETNSGCVMGERKTIKYFACESRHVVEGSVDVFNSIPYANEPTGALRFLRPEPVTAWCGTINTTVPPNACPQLIDFAFKQFEGTDEYNPKTPQSEDCLYLTVVAPVGASNLSTMAWIYGGSFQRGACSLDIYDLKVLAHKENIIVACIQYRVGALGFLFDQLNANEETGGAPGNMGLWDQSLALQWIYDNIENFGGKKSSITIFGESAGAASVGFHLLSEESKHLFTRAIMQSGAPTNPWATLGNATATSFTSNLTTVLVCNNEANPIDCVRNNRTTAQILEAQEVLGTFGISFSPVIDGTFLSKDIFEIMEEGSFKNTEILLGHNKEEGSVFLLPRLFEDPVNTHIRRALDKNLFVPRAVNDVLLDSFVKILTDVVQVHPIIKHQYTAWDARNNDLSNALILSDLIGDSFFAAGIIQFAGYYSRAGNKTYMYYFTHQSSQSRWPKWTDPIHGAEIYFHFGEPLRINSHYPCIRPLKWYTRKERVFSCFIMESWANFARTGDPGDEWPFYLSYDDSESPYKYAEDSDIEPERQSLYLNAKERFSATAKEKEGHFWNTLLPEVAQNCSGGGVSETERTSMNPFMKVFMKHL